MHAAALRLDLRIRDPRSLKEKRHVLKSIISHVGREYGVAVAEVDHQELWNRATIGIAAVAPQASQLDRILHSVKRHMSERHDCEVLDTGISYLEKPE